MGDTSIATNPIKAEEALALHRWMQKWIVSTKYSLTQNERRVMWGMQNKSNVIGAGIGMFSFAAMRRISPKFAALNPGAKMASNLIYRYAAIPSLFVYMKVYRDCQTFMLPIFYTDMISMHYSSPFGTKAADIIGEMRRGNSETRLTALINTPAAGQPIAPIAGTPATGSDAKASSTDSPSFSSSDYTSSSSQESKDEWGSSLESQPFVDPYAKFEATHQAAPSRDQRGANDAWMQERELGMLGRSQDPWGVTGRQQENVGSSQDAWVGASASGSEQPVGLWASHGQESTHAPGEGMWDDMSQSSGVGKSRTRKTWDDIRAQNV